MTQTTDRAHAIDPAELKRRVGQAVEARRDELIALSHAIHADPEPAFEEHHAAQRVADAIRAAGFAVEHPAGSLSTAVRGRLTGGLGIAAGLRRRRPSRARGWSRGPGARAAAAAQALTEMQLVQGRAPA